MFVCLCLIFNLICLNILWIPLFTYDVYFFIHYRLTLQYWFTVYSGFFFFFFCIYHSFIIILIYSNCNVGIKSLHEIELFCAFTKEQLIKISKIPSLTIWYARNYIIRLESIGCMTKSNATLISNKIQKQKRLTKTGKCYLRLEGIFYWFSNKLVSFQFYSIHSEWQNRRQCIWNPIPSN